MRIESEVGGIPKESPPQLAALPHSTASLLSSSLSRPPRCCVPSLLSIYLSLARLSAPTAPLPALSCTPLLPAPLRASRR